MLTWRGPDAGEGDTTFLVCISEVGAPNAPWLKGTSISSEDFIVLGDSTTGEVTGAGLCVLTFFLHHTSQPAREAFEAASGLSIREDHLDDVLCLASIPQDDAEGLGLSLLVRTCGVLTLHGSLLLPPSRGVAVACLSSHPHQDPLALTRIPLRVTELAAVAA